MLRYSLFAINLAVILVAVENSRIELLTDIIERISLSDSEESACAESGWENNYPCLTDYTLMGVHNEGLKPAIVADKSNFVNDFANFLNAKNVDEMDCGSASDINNIITERIDAVCPVVPDCNTLDLTYRPISEVCNNLVFPLDGNPNIAQIRLARAKWENSALVTVRGTEPGILTPLDPLGLRFNNFFVFHVGGSAPFRLTVLAPEETCDTVSVNSGSSTLVAGVITSVSPYANSFGWCVEGYSYFFLGNELSVGDYCSGDFSVCFQPILVEVEIVRDIGGTSTLKVDDIIVDTFTNTAELYPTSSMESSPFWIEIENGAVSIGTGTDSNSATVFMSGTCPFTGDDLGLELLSWRFNLAFGSQSAGDIFLQSPVLCWVELETDLQKGVNLDEYRFLWDKQSLRFGVDYYYLYENTYIVIIADITNGITIAVYIGEFNGVTYFEQGVQVASQSFDSTMLDDLPVFYDGNDDPNDYYGAIWVTWLENKVYVGCGNIIGNELLLTAPLSLDIGDAVFTAERVGIHSTSVALWLFDLVQFGVPRKSSDSGRKLPTPRDVSLRVHSNIGQSPEDSPTLTMAVMNFGQFLDHDLVATPVEEVAESEPIMCCVGGKPLANQSRFCLNIEVTTVTDPNGSQGQFPHPAHECIPFVRSSAALECASKQDLRSREQLNTVTSFVDGSNIYDSTEEKSKLLREEADFTGALMRTTQNMKELPTSTDAGEGCRNEANPSQLCFKAGDFRVSEQPGLTGMHALWVREHNRIANAFIAAGWATGSAAEREIVFQETRRIVIAEYQNVVYNGYLPAFLDESIYNQFELGHGQCDYDYIENPNGINEWGISNRMGHTWVRPTLQGENIDLVEHFFNPALITNQGSDFLHRNLYESKCVNTDRILESFLTEDLFRSGPNALDLAALNIQRGRDHGVSYCALREALRLEVPYSFNDAEQMGLFSSETINVLSESYDCICDVDLFTAIVSEKPLIDMVPGSTSPNGETLNHIQGTFFRCAKCGDRYWYEFPSSGFNANQITSIQDATLSSIICANTDDVTTIQVDSFLAESSTNPSVNCDNIPSLDLSLFTSGLKRSNVDINVAEEASGVYNITVPNSRATGNFNERTSSNARPVGGKLGRTVPRSRSAGGVNVRTLTNTRSNFNARASSKTRPGDGRNTKISLAERLQMRMKEKSPTTTVADDVQTNQIDKQGRRGKDARRLFRTNPGGSMDARGKYTANRAETALRRVQGTKTESKVDLVDDLEARAKSQSNSGEERLKEEIQKLLNTLDKKKRQN